MGAFNQAVITDAGEALITKILAGTATLSLTRAVTSNYEYPEGTDIKTLTDLLGIQQTMSNPKAQIESDTVIAVQALFGNADITQAYDIWNVGLYAMDGESEILFSVSQAQEPDQMPAFEGVAPSSYIYDIRLTISQASEITIEVNPAGTVTNQEFITFKNEVNQEFDRLTGPPIPVTLTAAGWTGSAAPYSQTAAAEGLTADDFPILVSQLADGATEDTQKAYNKAFGIVAAGTGITGDGTVTFKVYKKPEIDIMVGLKL